jgi:hypothetical protein
MQNVDSVLLSMNQRADAWEKAHDQRFVFLRCYSMMSTNMAAAIRESRFADPPWVTTLMLHFAGYYFDALAQYEHQPDKTAAVWRQAFDANLHLRMHVMQNLLLGINAHINYDLPLSLYDCLRDDWAAMDKAQRRLRQDDHKKVNQIIGQTIDAVQDSVIGPHAPALVILDRLLGRMDEWLLAQLITSWRRNVWNVAIQLLESSDDGLREAIRQEQERRVMEWGKRLIDAF